MFDSATSPILPSVLSASVSARARAARSAATAPLIVLVLLLAALATGSASADTAPDVPEATYWFSLAKLRADASDYKGAADAFERVIALDGTDPYAFLEVGRFYSFLAQISRSPMQQTQYLESAVEHLASARDLAPDNDDVLRSFGDLHIRLAERRPASLALAQGAFETLRARRPDDIQVLMSLGQIYLWARDAEKAVEVLNAAESVSPQNRLVKNMLVEALLGTGDEADAARALEQLVEAEPGDLEHRLRLAELRGRAGDHDGAVAVLRDAPEELRGDERVQRIIARELHLAGRSAEARELLRTMAGANESDEGFRRLRLAVHGSLLDYETAAADLRVLMDSAAEAGDASRRRGDALLLARLEERLGRVDEAETLLRSELDRIDEQETPATLQVRLALVDLLERGARYDEAAALLRRGMAGGDTRQRVAQGQVLAEILVEAGRTAEAVELLGDLADELEAEAGGSSPSPSDAPPSDATDDVVPDRTDEGARAADAAQGLRLRRLLVLSDGERWDELLAQLQSIQAGDDELRVGLDQLRAEALAGLGQLDEALQLLERTAAQPSVGERERRALFAKRVELLFENGRADAGRSLLAQRVTSGTVDDLLLAAQLYQREEMYDESVPLLEQAADARPDDLQILFALGASQERSGAFEASESSFERLLSLEADHVPSLNYLGYMWAERGVRLDEAEELVRRAVASEPDNGAYVDSLGWVFHRQGRHEEALAQLRWAARLIRDDPTIHDHLGDVYRALGRAADAERAYRRALDLIDAGGSAEPGDVDDPSLRRAVEQKLEQLDVGAAESKTRP